MFKIDKRMEYYMSKIALEHDGGTVTEIDSFYKKVREGYKVYKV